MEKQFCKQITEILDKQVTIRTKYHDIEGWSSLSAVMVAGMIEEMYGVEITDKDLKNNVTVHDLFKLCSKK
jgi:acyl carrier protein